MIREAEHRAVIVIEIPVTSVRRAIRRPETSARSLARSSARVHRLSVIGVLKCATGTDVTGS